MIEVLQKLIEEKVRCSVQQVETTSRKCIENMKAALKEIKEAVSSSRRRRMSEPPSDTTVIKRANVVSTSAGIQNLPNLSPIAYHQLTDEQYSLLRNSMFFSISTYFHLIYIKFKEP